MSINPVKNHLITLLLCFLIIPSGLNAQQVKGPFDFPDIIGYQTLVCDFHMHTVFSDGLVWPTVRIDEAANQGLDAISITEHIEYLPNSADLLGDHNRAYEIAKARADKKGIILIRGAEITRDMPPGHFNAIFLKDANLLDKESWQDAIQAANDQGAFVFWNHPGWRQPDEIPIWYNEHSWLLSKGWIQGIEIVNENSYYPLAHQWALDSGLTIIGNSDIHDPVDMFFDKCEGEHRPVMLVFSTERTKEGIKEAIIDKRTAVYYKNMLIGDERFLKPLFLESIEGIVAVFQGSDKKPITYYRNKASITFEVSFFDANGKELGSIDLLPGISTELKAPFVGKNVKWVVNNIIISPDRYLEIDQEQLK